MKHEDARDGKVPGMAEVTINQAVQMALKGFLTVARKGQAREAASQEGDSDDL